MKIMLGPPGLMSYTRNRPEIASNIYFGIYRNYYFNIVDLGTHPCAYIGVEEGHTLYGIGYDAAYKLVDIDVHGGLTYAGYDMHFPWPEKNLWWLGWDYAHLGDYVGYDEYRTSRDKKWKFLEILEHTIRAIDQLCE